MNIERLEHHLNGMQIKLQHISLGLANYEFWWLPYYFEKYDAVGT